MKFAKKLFVFFSLVFICTLIPCKAEFTGNMEQFANEVNQEINSSPESAAEFMETTLKKFFVGVAEVPRNDFCSKNVIKSLALPPNSKIKSVSHDGAEQFKYSQVPVRLLGVDKFFQPSIFKNWIGLREEILFEIESNGKKFYRILCKGEGVVCMPGSPGECARYTRYYTYTYNPHYKRQDICVVFLDVFIRIPGFESVIKILDYKTWMYSAFEIAFGKSYFSTELKSLK